MRVISGTRRSMPLKAPKGMETRPTQDRTKETLFNVLQNYVGGCEFLDLFSGSGSIGIEALSRGAAAAVFVENSRNAILCIKENLEFTHFKDNSTVMETDVMTALEKIKGHIPFDIIFMDPPYAVKAEPAVLKVLKDAGYVTENTIIVMEMSLDRNMDFIEENGFEILKIKKYKTNCHVFIKRQ